MMDVDVYENQCDLAISIYEQYCLDPNDPSIQNLADEINLPDWTKITDKMHLLWSKNYEKSIKILESQTEIQSHMQKFEQEVRKMICKRVEYTNWQKFFDYVIDYEVKMFKNVINGTNERIIQRVDNTQTHSKQPQMYELAHMIRAHSKDGKADDDTVEIYDVAFEPVSENSQEELNFTNIVATCGGPIVNFINVETGEVIKQFKDEIEYNRTKEKFYQVIWSFICSKSVLFCAGFHGEIKAIIPQESTCVLRFKEHDKPIKSLLVHPKDGSILFSASEDGFIKEWKIEMDQNNRLSYKQISSIDSLGNILSMCIINNFLLVTSFDYNYRIRLHTHEQTQLKAKKLEFNEEYEDKMIINKLIAFKNVLIANLAQSSMTYVFEFTQDKCLNRLYSFDLGQSTSWYQSKISLGKENNCLVILKATDNGCFYKVEMDDTFTKRKTKMKFIIPHDYKIKSNNSMISIQVRNQNLLEAIKVFNCVSNENYIVNTTNNNLIVVWKKKN